MKVVNLIENTSKGALSPAHGLSLYVESSGRRILFDVGPSFDILRSNADKAGIDLSSVDFVVISHGHYDHGGALAGFLEFNSRAKVFISKESFGDHSNITKTPRKYIGLDQAIRDNPGVVLTGDGFRPFEGALLFTVTGAEECHSPMNDVLWCGAGPDEFYHEQNMILSENGKNVLFCGCGHKGIVNIMNKARTYGPSAVIGGFHLSNPSTGACVSDGLLDCLCESLSEYPDTDFRTCHCTGAHPYEYLSHKMNNIHYFSCGETLEI